jgi:hypothetical protein
VDVSLQEFLKKDDELFNCFSEHAEQLIYELKRSEFPNSTMCLMGLMGTINSLKLAAFDLAEESETHLYAIKTMLRPAIEHFLRFNYIHIQLVETKDDTTGEEYRKYSSISEAIAIVKSQFALETDKTIQEKTLKRLKESQNIVISNRQLEQIVLKWSYKNIARKLEKILNTDKEQIYFFRKLVSLYSELSSFVHGGVYAEQYYHDVFSSGTLAKEVRSDIEFFSFMAATARSNMLLLGCHINPKLNSAFSDYSKKMAQLLGSMSDA